MSPFFDYRCASCGKVEEHRYPIGMAPDHVMHECDGESGALVRMKRIISPANVPPEGKLSHKV